MSINFNEKPLNEALIEIGKIYKLNISLDDKELSKYSVSVNEVFQSPEEIFSQLLYNLPVDFEISAGVYLFYPKEPIVSKSIKYRLSGKIFDFENSESLPFSNIIINDNGGISDEYGYFNFESNQDSLFHIQISYLGYQTIDTVLVQGVDHEIGLISRMVNIKGLTIIGNHMFFSRQTGEKAGFIRLNHKVAKFIPGNGDNSIFNILRLQPGILAAGEQSSEMIVWGSYQGQSQITFDGMTRFGLKNYNDNISTVNPYLAKDVRVHKGGYDATLGERVGAIIDITGIDGNKYKTKLNFTLNNMTMNMVAEIPFGKRSSLVGAYRQTYYELYSPNYINLNQREDSHMSDDYILVNPDYIFRDGNLKYSGQSKNGDSYQISSFWGQDHFSYLVDQAHLSSTISQELDERNSQFGVRVVYNKQWKGVGSSTIAVSYSALQTENFSRNGFAGMDMHEDMDISQLSVQNDIDEFKITMIGNRRMGAKHEVDYGGSVIYNSAILNQESTIYSVFNVEENGTQFVSYIQNRYTPNKYISVVFGLHNNYFSKIRRNYIQPRLSLAVNPVTNLRLNASWGLYNQFIAHNTIIDENNNYRYQWRISDGQIIPILSSQHFVAGGVYNQKGFTYSLEGFYKKTNGISRSFSINNQQTVYSGDSKTRGIDMFLKQEYNGHSIWLSYTLSETLEWFPYFNSSNYERAFHDQRHELKMAVILNFSPFYISANYVYGTGFPPNSISNLEYPYKRFDIAAVYKFQLKEVIFETGFSILNLFNYENIKYANFIKIPTDGENAISIYSESVPFTPTLFLNISI